MATMVMAGLPLSLVSVDANEAAEKKNQEIVLSVARVEEIAADATTEFTVTLSFYNVGGEPLYVSPVPGEIAGVLEIMVTPKGSKAEPDVLFSRVRPYRGYAFEDLFRLMPGRALRYSVRVRYRPSFAGEGAVELWAKYDGAEMAKGDPRAFALPLQSERVEIRVKRPRFKPEE